MNQRDISILVEEAVRWVEAQRGIHRPGARAFSESETVEFSRFFDAQILDSTRIKAVPVIEEPGFLSALGEAGKRDLLLTFTRMAGITFEDTIVISQSQTPLRSQLSPLLFHELVHVVQYEILGVRGFMQRYIDG